MDVAAGAGIVIEDTELAPTAPSPSVDGITGASFTARRVNIHGTVDGKAGTGARVEASWVHDLTVSGNWVDGGGCTLNLAHKGGASLSSVFVTGNRFGRNSFFSWPIL